jgi:hypothetical protein
MVASSLLALAWIRPVRAAESCGLERWDVKTGLDATATSVSLADVIPTTIARLTAYPRTVTAPEGRSNPVETTVWMLDATMVEAKLEGDRDIHLVLRDRGQTMIAEIVDPGCVAFMTGITRARSQFDASYQAGSAMMQIGVPVRITGVGFFDFRHHQTGVATNAVELHPVLAISFYPSGALPLPPVAPRPAGTAAPGASAITPLASLAGLGLLAIAHRRSRSLPGPPQHMSRRTKP